MLHWYMKPKIMSGKELKMPTTSSVALYAPSVKPRLIVGLVPCKSTASKKMVKTMKKLTRTEIKLVNRRAVSCLGNDIGNVINYDN